MTKLDDATPKQLFREIKRRLKNEITNAELTEQFWENMEPDEDQLRATAERTDLNVMSEDEIAEEVASEIPNTEIFRLITKLAYLPDLATIQELNELQKEARYLLSTEYKQFHGMGV